MLCVCSSMAVVPVSRRAKKRSGYAVGLSLSDTPALPMHFECTCRYLDFYVHTTYSNYGAPRHRQCVRCLVESADVERFMRCYGADADTK